MYNQMLGCLRASVCCISRKGQSDFTLTVGYVAEAFVEFAFCHGLEAL